MRPLLLLLCLFAASSSALFLKKKYHLFGGLFGRGGGRTRCGGCNCGSKPTICTYPPQTTYPTGKPNCPYPPRGPPCPYPPTPPVVRPPRIICRYAEPGYGHQFVYGTSSGGGYSHQGGYGSHGGYGHHGGHVALVGSGAHGGGQRIKYQTVGFKGAAPIKGYSSGTSRELVVGARTFQVPGQHQGVVSSPTFVTSGGTAFSNPTQVSTKIAPSTNFGSFASGYADAQDKFKASNFHSSLKD